MLDANFGNADAITGFNAGGSGTFAKDLFNVADLLTDNGVTGTANLVGFYAAVTPAQNALAMGDGLDNLPFVLTKKLTAPTSTVT